MVSQNFQMTGPAVGGTVKILGSQVAGANKKRKRRQQMAAASTTSESSAFGSPTPTGQDDVQDQMGHATILTADPSNEGLKFDEVGDEMGANAASFSLATEAQEYETALPSIERDQQDDSVLQQAEGSVPASNAAQYQRTIDDRSDRDSGAVILDPKASPRQYVHDPYTAVQREIWRPGDADGDPNGDYGGRPGGSVNLPLNKRWRFYQSSFEDEPWSKKNMPPRFVVLDDRAAFEIFNSEIAKHNLPKWWSHDFAGQGKLIKHRRVHRGRPAIARPDMLGDDMYHSAPSRDVKKPEMYYFSGQQGYTPIIYRSAVKAEDAAKKRKAGSPADNQPVAKKQHNQFTPYEELIKNGAPSTAKSRNTNKAKLERFLKRPPSPTWPENPAKVYTGVANQARAFNASSVAPNRPDATSPSCLIHAKRHTQAQQRAGSPDHGEQVGREPESDDIQALLDSQSTQTGPAAAPVVQTTAESNYDGSEDEDAFLFPRKKHEASTAQPLNPSHRTTTQTESGHARDPGARICAAIQQTERLGGEAELQTIGPVQRVLASSEGSSTSERAGESVDSGTSSAQLERQLAEANSKIADLVAARDTAEAYTKELEEEILRLRPLANANGGD